MKRNKKISSIIVVVICLSIFIPTMSEADSYEPDDSIAIAKGIIVGNDFQNHDIDPANDVDMVKFEAVEGYGYVIELANESGGDIHYQLFNANADALTDNISTLQEWRCPLTGTYYIQIWEWKSDQQASYQVRVLPAYWNGTAVWDGDYEPDDNKYNACLVRTDGTVYHHENGDPADFDWACFTAEEGRTYNFSLANETGGDYHFDVYDAGYRGLSGNQSTSWTWTCPVTGTYYVRIWEWSHDQAGNFDFRITGNVVDYTVDIPNTHVTLYLNTTYGVDAYQLAANCSNGNDEIVWSCDDGSVVTVSAIGMLDAQASGTATVTATCTVTGMSDDVIVTVNTDDYEPNSAQALARPIAVGPLFQSHLLIPNGPDPDQIDWVKFEAVEGYGYVIELANESGGNVHFKIFNANADALTDNISALQEWRCPLTGTYYIQIWEWKSDQQASYQVRVLPAYWNGTAVWDSDYEPDDNKYNACLIRTDGTVYHHENGNPADFDWVCFTAEEGRTYNFSLANETGGDYHFKVYDAGYRGLSEYQSTSWTWTCPVTGTYYVGMWEWSQDQAGNFDFRITGDEVDYAVDIPNTHVTLYLDTTYGVDTYQIAANCSNGNDEIVWSCDDGSVVTVKAGGMLDAQAAGTATVTATCTITGMSDDVIVTVNADDYEPNSAQALARPIAVGPLFQSHLLIPNGPDPDQIDWVKFEAVEGYGYVIELANESGGNVHFKLFNANADALTDNISALQEWRCPLTGTYYIQIWEWNSDQQASYQVRVLPAYWNGTAVWDGAYESNDNGYNACFICTDNSPLHSYNERCDDFDWFRFFAVQDSIYVLSLSNELGGNFHFLLYDSEFSSVSGSQTDNMTWTCPATGLYHVRIWEYNTDQRGSYDFRIHGEPVTVDSDNDGMDDCWEINYFGNGNLNRDGAGDWDGDGLSDKEEFDNGTDPTIPEEGGDGSGGGCFIATAAYGSAMESHVMILRNSRDAYLLSCKLGRMFVSTYYRYSPPIADLVAKHDTLKHAVRMGLLPLVISCSALHFGPAITATGLLLVFAFPVFMISVYRRRLRDIR